MVVTTRLGINLNPNRKDHQNFAKELKKFAKREGMTLSGALLFLARIGLAEIREGVLDSSEAKIISAGIISTRKKKRS